MFDKGSNTRQRLLNTALALFRERGFDNTTMRDIAKAAGVATGATYYHFPSKDSLVSAFFLTVQEAHLALLTAQLSNATSLKERLTIAYRTAIDVAADDRAMLHVAMRHIADRDHPLSLFGPGTSEVRELSRGIYQAALQGTEVPSSLMPLAVRAAWALHMGLMLYLFYDPSPDARATYKLADQAAALAADVLAMISSPMGKTLAAPFITRIEQALRDAAILPAEERP